MLMRERHSALVIVDMQEKLLAAMPGSRERCLRNSMILIDAATALGIPVFNTRQYPDGLGDTDAALRARLPASTQHFDKTCFSCCGAGGFVDALTATERRQILLAGVEAHVCVLQTASELKALGYDVFIAADATASRNDEHRVNALDRLRRHGIEITNTESALFEWLKDASHENFKQLSRLIR